MPARRRREGRGHGGSERRRDHHDAHPGPHGPAAVEPLALARHLGLGTVWILDGVEVTIVGAIASRLQDKQTLGLSAFEIAFGGTCYIIGAAIGAIGFGYLTDRLGRKKLFIVTLAVYLAATVATAFTWSAASFWIFRIAHRPGHRRRVRGDQLRHRRADPRAGARLGRPRDQRLLLARAPPPAPRCPSCCSTRASSRSTSAGGWPSASARSWAWPSCSCAATCPRARAG